MMLLRARRSDSPPSLPSLLVKPVKTRIQLSYYRRHLLHRHRVGLFLLSAFSCCLLFWSISPAAAKAAVTAVRVATSLDRRVFHVANTAVSDWLNVDDPLRPSPQLFQDDQQNINMLIDQARIPPVFVSRLGIQGRRKLLRRLTADTTGILLYDQMPKIIIADLQNGLGNRLRVLASCMEYAFYTRRILVVLWAPDLHLNATMQSLFDQLVIDRFILIQHPVTWPINPNHLPTTLTKLEKQSYKFVTTFHPSIYSFRYFNFMAKDVSDHERQQHQQNSYRNNSSLYPNPYLHLSTNDKRIQYVYGRHIYVKTAYILESKYTSHKLVNAFMQALTPSTQVLNLVHKVEDECGGPISIRRMVGVHIRSRSTEKDNQWIDSECEYTAQGAATTDKWRKKSAPDHFITEMKHIQTTWKKVVSKSYGLEATNSLATITSIPLVNNNNEPASVIPVDVSIPPKFYVSADSLEAIHVLRKNFDSNQLVTLKRQCDDRSAECMQYAFADLILLSRTGAMLGSGWSSFTEAASRLRVRPPGVDPSRTDGYTLRLSGIDFAIPGRTERWKTLVLERLPWTKAYRERTDIVRKISENERSIMCEQKRARRHQIHSNKTEVD